MDQTCCLARTPITKVFFGVIHESIRERRETVCEEVKEDAAQKRVMDEFWVQVLHFLKQRDIREKKSAVVFWYVPCVSLISLNVLSVARTTHILYLLL